MIFLRKSILFIVLTGFNLLYAQQMISLDEAIKLALQNNYGIEIARGEQEIAKINNDFGNAGFLPQIEASSGNVWSNNNLHQETNTGVISDNKGVNGSTLNASVGATWILFDGTKMFVTHRVLGELEKLSEFQTKMAIEDLVYQVITQYYTLVKIKQQIKLSESLIELFLKRKKVAEAKNSNGSSSLLEVLQAQADYNAQNATLLKLQSQFSQNQYNLASLMTNNPLFLFQINDSIVLNPLLNIEQIKTKFKTNNIQLKSIETNLSISNLTLKEAKSGYFPKLGLGLNYNFTNTDNSSGYILNNQTYGLNYGITASWNLFNGMMVKRNVKKAKIRQRMMQLTFNELNNQLETALLSQFNGYETNLKILTMEEQNIKTAQTALNIAMEKYSLGVINDIQFKDAQKTFEDAQLRLIQARYDVKMSETVLLKLQGLLVQ